MASARSFSRRATIGVVIAVGNDGVELQRLAKLDAIVGGAFIFRIVVQERGEGFFGLRAVGGGAVQVAERVTEPRTG